MQRPLQRGPIAHLLRKRAIVTKAQAELEYTFRSIGWREPLIAHSKDGEPTYRCRICAANVRPKHAQWRTFHECAEHFRAEHTRS
ncbi:hypothetical protein [Bradyrhizobium liaoningense]|uniref:hypothetical protein n=1 Tax=Bradyrhizobium liaoningense TaxID=43992 RepID=UPI001BAAC6F7|nr:hypothetical protein [Bradyrhizobium liaoningense]MBR0719707.1 hypothetical protein [Bradyrhizobium liaoningense]